MGSNPLKAVKAKVQVRQQWGGTWIDQPYLIPVEWTLAAAPSIGQATFRYNAGPEIKREDSNTFGAFSPLSIVNYFCRILILRDDSPPGTEWFPIWHGIIPDDETTLRSDSQLVADQRITAYELAYVFDQVTLDYAQVFEAGCSSSPVRIDRSPAFNERHPRGGRAVLGNRSESQYNGTNGGIFPIASYVFQKNGREWTSLQILDYLRAWYFPSQFAVGFGGLPGMLSILIEIHDFDGLSLWKAINRLATRRRGIVFDLRVNPSDESLVLHLQSTSAVDISFGSLTLPANTEKITFGLPTEFPYTHLMGDVPFRLSSLNLYDRLVVRGQPVKVTFTVSFADGTLAVAWDTSKEEPYRQALGAGQDANRNDQFRSREEFRGVFTAFKFPDNWDGKAKDGAGGGQKNNVFPTCLPDGSVGFSTLGNFWLGGKRLERDLPFQQDTDYSANVPKIPERESPPRWTQKPFRPLLVLIKDDQASRQHTKDDHWHLVDRLTGFDSPPASVAVRPLDFGLGFEFNGGLRHQWALGHWPAATPDTHRQPDFNYEKLLATVLLETDVRQFLAEDLAANPQRPKIINVPSAEYWAVVTGAVVDMDADGGLKRIGSANLVLRNDLAKLQAVMAFAKAWYGQVRQAVTLPIRDLLLNSQAASPLIVGSMLVGIQGLSIPNGVQVGTVVTARRFNYETQTETIETGHAEQDFSIDDMLDDTAASAPAEVARQVAAVPAVRRIIEAQAFMNVREPLAPLVESRSLYRRGILLSTIQEGGWAMVQPICTGPPATSGSGTSGAAADGHDCCRDPDPDRVWSVIGCANAGEMIAYFWNQDVADDVDGTCGRYETAPCGTDCEDSPVGSSAAGGEDACASAECMAVCAWETTQYVARVVADCDIPCQCGFAEGTCFVPGEVTFCPCHLPGTTWEWNEGCHS